MTDLRWYGWGYADKTYSLDHRPDARNFLRSVLELRGDESFSACDFDALRLCAPRLTCAQLNALRQIVPETKTDTHTRVLHAYGKAYRDLICLRRGEIPHPPDAVVYPVNEDAIARVIAFCVQSDFALIPFGGGTSVGSGVEPRDERVTVALDLARLNRVIALDEVSQTAMIEAGTRGPDLERALNARGFTLGHFPESFEFATLGGWLATRDDNIAALTQSVRVVTPRGVIETRAETSPALLELLIGSEGALGIIARATMRVRRLPKTKDRRALLFKSFADGVAALRALSQSEISPTVVRLLDQDATRAFHAFSPRKESRGWKALLEQLGLNFLISRNQSFEQGALMILGFEDDAAGAHAGQQICRSHGAFDLGRGVADAWLRDRDEMPYLRDVLMDHGVLVDTLKATVAWSNLERLHKTLATVIADAAVRTGSRALVMTHVSHCRRDGANLCVTFLARMARGKEIEQWETLKRAATDCIIANGGVFPSGDRDALVTTIWHAVKDALDPNNVMNPGRWLSTELGSIDAAIEYQERFWNLPIG